MQILDKQTKFAHLGKPGAVFSKGFARRLRMITNSIDLKHKTILDVGCGEGVWLRQFSNYTDLQNIFGTDVDPESLETAKRNLPQANLQVAFAEKLPFADNSFDVVFSHEVIEHVVNDADAVQEMIRVCKPEGKVIIFTPNRAWPFEQHGMFVAGKYVWGNIPLLPWMPGFIYSRLAPHVRNYWPWQLTKLWTNQPVKVSKHVGVFPGFDGLERRLGGLGRFIRRVVHALERTPLHRFGISHFVILTKTSSTTP